MAREKCEATGVKPLWIAMGVEANPLADGDVALR